MLKQGDSFGELSLITSKPRLATVKSNMPWEFAILNKEKYQNTLGILQEEKVNAKLEELNTIPFFVEYSRAFKTRLLFWIEILEFNKDQYVFKEDSTDKNLYFIVKGEFEISK